MIRIATTVAAITNVLLNSTMAAGGIHVRPAANGDQAQGPSQLLREYAPKFYFSFLSCCAETKQMNRF